MTSSVGPCGCVGGGGGTPVAGDVTVAMATPVDPTTIQDTGLRAAPTFDG